MAVKKRLLFFFAAIILGVGAGCQTVQKENEFTPQKTGKNDYQQITGDITPVAKKYQENFFKAIEKRDVNLIRADLIPEQQEELTPKRFTVWSEAIGKNMGKLEKVSYLGSIDRGLFKIFIWKFSAEKDRIKLADGTELPRESMFTMMIGQVDGKQLILSWRFH